MKQIVMTFIQTSIHHSIADELNDYIRKGYNIHQVITSPYYNNPQTTIFTIILNNNEKHPV